MTKVDISVNFLY